MSPVQHTEEFHARRNRRLVGWGLLAGGVFFFVGGSMHPSDDPPGLSLKEHLELLFSDPAWYPSHALMLIGMTFIAASLVGVVRADLLAPVRRARSVGVMAAVAGVLAALGALLHLVVASEADRLAAGESTPLTNLHVVVETLTVPPFGLSLAALAVVGAMSRTVGNRGTAVLGVIGGTAYALAAGTLLFTDALNFLFPLAGAIGLWAIAAGLVLVRRSRTERGSEHRGADSPRPVASGASR